MIKLMIGEGYIEDRLKNPQLFLLMYTGEIGEKLLDVTIKDTQFSTNKVFNETYARL
jgi:hypothetical protein